MNRLSVAALGRSCLISVDGRHRILTDPGGGTFSSSRTSLELSSLEQILLTRMEIDCTGDLAAVLMHLYTRERRRSIALTGPDGQPGADEFVRLLFGAEGAWRYLSAFSGFGITTRQTPSAVSDLAVYYIPVGPVLQILDVSLYAVAVAGGLLPGVAFRVQCEDESIVLAGSISHFTPSFMALAADCDVLVVRSTIEAAAIDEMRTQCHAKELLFT